MFNRLFSSGNGDGSDEDGANPEQLRNNMVERQIKGRGIRDERILEAMRKIPRHKFVPGAGTNEAYEDHPLPIGCDQTISQPYIVALMTSSLELEEHHSVLEIGTGSGYQAALLAHIVEKVYTIERHEELADRAKDVLYELGYDNVTFRVGDGTKGWPEKAPFDRIVVTAGAPSVPDSLIDQLDEDGGKLVIPVGERRSQRLTRITRTGDDVEKEELGSCVFVQLIGEEGW